LERVRAKTPEMPSSRRSRRPLARMANTDGGSLHPVSNTDGRRREGVERAVGAGERIKRAPAGGVCPV
jgi:hypothetical protein